MGDESCVANPLKNETPAGTYAPLVSLVLKELGSHAQVIDSARATALVVAQAAVGPSRDSSEPYATFACYATDSVEKFARLGSRFLGQPISQVELLDLGG